MMRPLRNERGAALAMALIFLMVLLIIVAALHRTTLFELVLSRNYQESKKAYFAAESGIKDGLKWFSDNYDRYGNYSPGTNWYYRSAITTDDPPFWSPDVSIDGCTYHYYIEKLDKVENVVSGQPRRTFYRITAEGVSNGSSITRRVQIVVCHDE